MEAPETQTERRKRDSAVGASGNRWKSFGTSQARGRIPMLRASRALARRRACMRTTGLRRSLVVRRIAVVRPGATQVRRRPALPLAAVGAEALELGRDVDVAEDDGTTPLFRTFRFKRISRQLLDSRPGALVHPLDGSHEQHTAGQRTGAWRKHGHHPLLQIHRRHVNEARCVPQQHVFPVLGMHNCEHAVQELLGWLHLDGRDVEAAVVVVRAAHRQSGGSSCRRATVHRAEDLHGVQ
eukprot:scaffold733_cov267-Pinguiococcus_pyrenoidosus.AAC.27